jgi:hypothetical protein
MNRTRERFYKDMLKGNQVKELVKILLEKAGYMVLPYGYEATLSDIKKRLREKGVRNSRTVRRIRTSPDLLVYDQERKDAMLVEVKMRGVPKEANVEYLRIANYREFWNDSILILVIPWGSVFYAQKVCELEIKQTYDIMTDFEKMEDIFTKVKTQDIADLRGQALKIMGR